MPRQRRNIKRHYAVLDGANVPAEPTDYSTMSTEAFRLMLGERHHQQTGNRHELVSQLQQNELQRPPASQSESVPSNSGVTTGVPHVELAALIASIVDERMNRQLIQDGRASNASNAQCSGPVLLHCHKMAAKTQLLNNLLPFRNIQQVISSQTPPFLLVSLLFLVLVPSLLLLTFLIQPKSHRFTLTFDSLPSPAI